MRLRWLGAILATVGLVLFLVSAVIPMLAMAGFMKSPFGPGGFGGGSGGGVAGGFDSLLTSFILSFVLGTIGIVLLGVGAFALKLGFVGPVAGYVATEAAPAIRTASAALGGGLRDVGFGPSPPAGTPADVRVKCRSCGYLETEDAEFCSKCGQRL